MDLDIVVAHDGMGDAGVLGEVALLGIRDHVAVAVVHHERVHICLIVIQINGSGTLVA